MWVTVAEALYLALLLVIGPGVWVRVVIGLPILAHLAYTRLASLPRDEEPTLPKSVDGRRRNYELRKRVEEFLNEVKRMERYAVRAKAAGLPRSEVEDNLRSVEKRLHATVAEVPKVVGRGREMAGPTPSSHPETHATLLDQTSRSL